MNESILSVGMTNYTNEQILDAARVLYLDSDYEYSPWGTRIVYGDRGMIKNVSDKRNLT